MKKMILILLCLSLLSVIAAAKPQGRRRAHRHAKTITVTGCISEGVEGGCLLLTTLDGKHKYSLNKSDELKVGTGYRIKGTLGGVDTCMQGPHLTPTKITPLRIHCPTP